MKLMRVGLGVLAGALLVVGYHSGTPTAFHSGGVAECNGCHSMHAAKSPGYLLVGTDQSSTCLTCHESVGDTGPTRYHMSTPGAEMPAGTAPKQLSPGGDFGWLKKTYSWVPRTGAATEYDYGQSHGHNIVAIDYSYVADTTNTVAPGGGAFLSSQLGCQSCHDPHGRARRLSDGTYVNAFYNPGSTNAPIMASGSYTNSPGSGGTAPVLPSGLAVGVYRLLRGLGDNSVGVTFSGVPIAIAPSTYNQSENTSQVRVAYGNAGANTWGDWCGTCHPTMHSNTNTVHPVDLPLNGVAANYNAYVKSGDLTGAQATAYSSLVPFVENTGTITTLASHASNSGSAASQFGPAATDQVSCQSCHRSHASGFTDMLRFGMGYEFVVYNGTYTGSVAAAQGRTEAEMRQAYYDRDPSKFASYQRVLCNKCHAKD